MSRRSISLPAPSTIRLITAFRPWLVVLFLAVLWSGGGCSSDDPKAVTAPAEPLPPLAASDASEPIPPPASIDGGAPSTGTVSAPIARFPYRRPTRKLELLLRSTPTGALAVVDGDEIGKTPVLWQVEKRGRAIEMEFQLENHRTARYRFIPMKDGIVHSRLLPGPASEGLDSSPTD